jgi:hypothetical protein
MRTDVLDRVLTIEEVKQKMKEIRTAAVHYGGVVHCGERGRDELVIVSSRTWEAVTAGKESGNTAAADANPYSAFERALKDGRLGGAGHAPEPRRRAANLPDETGLSLSHMIALGREEEPRRRRPKE